MGSQHQNLDCVVCVLLSGIGGKKRFCCQDRTPLVLKSPLVLKGVRTKAQWWRRRTKEWDLCELCGKAEVIDGTAHVPNAS